MTKEQRAAMAQDCFKANPKHDLYYQTIDGQCFQHWHDANEHSKTLDTRTIEEVRSGGDMKYTLAVHEKIDKINSCKDALELTAIKIGNKEHPDVVVALNAKLAQFSDEKARKTAEAIAKGAAASDLNVDEKGAADAKAKAEAKEAAKANAAADKAAADADKANNKK